MARSFGKLTAKKVEHLLNRGLYPDGGGLYLQVAKGGSKSWLYRFKVDGRTRWHGLGSVRDVTLEKARDKAADARRLRRDGFDPIETKHAAKAAARVEAAKSITFGVAARRYIKANAPGWKNVKHADQWRMTLLGIGPTGEPAKNDYCKTIRDLPIGALDTSLILKIIEPIWATKNETANRIRGRIECVIDAAKSRGEFIGENPARWRGHLENLLPAPSKVHKVRNHPALPYCELPAFIRELRAREGVAAAALEFHILTVPRPGNAVAAKWSDVDRKSAVWTIPGNQMKGDAEHKVPLNRAALDILNRMQEFTGDGEYIFASTGGAPLSDASMGAVINRMNEQERRWVDPASDREVVPHGFRSSFRDWAAEHGYDDSVAEAALAHKIVNRR